MWLLHSEKEISSLSSQWLVLFDNVDEDIGYVQNDQ